MIDLRKGHPARMAYNEHDRKRDQNVYKQGPYSNIEGQPTNRFVKNMLRKHGQPRGQQAGMQKKRAYGTIGTGTRG